MRTIFVALLLSVLSGAAHATENVDLNIPLGRIGIFGEQGQQAIDRLLAARDRKVHENAGAYRAIYEAVLQHNKNLAAACTHRLVQRKHCQKGPYRPRWLVMPGTRWHSQWRLKRMAEQAQDALSPLWSELCARAEATRSAKEVEEDGPFCVME